MTGDLFHFENEAWQTCRLVAGIDEAGRGAWAGPVVAAAVIFEPGTRLEGVNDSKKISPAKRENIYDQIIRSCVSYGVGIVPVSTIDSINILEATRQAMLQAVSMLNPPPELLLIDGNAGINSRIPQKTVIDGDALSFTIAAASILAKVTRDRLMKNLAESYPEFAFDQHKGYGTKTHREAIQRIGICSEHRRSYEPIARWLKENPQFKSNYEN